MFSHTPVLLAISISISQWISISISISTCFWKNKKDFFNQQKWRHIFFVNKKITELFPFPYTFSLSVTFSTELLFYNILYHFYSLRSWNSIQQYRVQETRSPIIFCTSEHTRMLVSPKMTMEPYPQFQLIHLAVPIIHPPPPLCSQI